MPRHVPLGQANEELNGELLVGDLLTLAAFEGGRRYKLISYLKKFKRRSLTSKDPIVRWPSPQALVCAKAFSVTQA